jgi:hypothetical protein
MRRDRTLVRASDVGLYAFCARAWWLARVQEAEHDNPARLAHGTSVHSAHGAQVRRIGQARRAALILIGAGVVLLIAFLALTIFGQ